MLRTWRRRCLGGGSAHAVQRGLAPLTTMLRHFSAGHVHYELLSYGENTYKVNTKYKFNKTVHAEEQAMLNLPPLPRNKKLKRVNLLVIRQNKTNMGSSKPCVHCILKLQELPKRGYVLNKIYFSTNTGIIVQCKLNDLLYDSEAHISSFYRGTGFQVK